MKVLTLARKPLPKGDSILKTLLAIGVGALNIDASRVKGALEIKVPQSDPTKREGVVGSNLGFTSASTEKFQNAQRESIERTNTLGRWPANLILMHLKGCQCSGNAQVGSGERRAAKPGAQPFCVKRGWNSHNMTRDGATAPESYGTETVAVWECAPGCPVAELANQSKIMGSHNAGQARVGFFGSDYEATSIDLGGLRPMNRFGDSGSISRFFFQIQQDSE